MAQNFKYTGRRLPVATASADLTSGALVVQEGLFGIALTSAKSGAPLWLGTEGVWTVPLAGVSKGDAIYVDNLSDDAAPTISTDPGFFIGTAVSDSDADDKFLLLIGPQGPRSEA